tara:strand:+ start:903 stop:1862 length:960 start_codon:yes stop_codon:yes gene_type:complete
MDIQAVKRSLFNDLKSPMSFLVDNGMRSNGPPHSARVFRNTCYFYAEDGQEWSILTPTLRVLKSTVNSFDSGVHMLVLESSAQWTECMQQQLREASQLVYDQQLLPQACAACPDFDTFWAQCRKPPFLTIETPAFSRRGHHKQFINMYHQGAEVTGVAALHKNGTVNIAIKWTLSESEESGQFGWRPHFAAGIQIHKFGGMPFAIRKPWSWENVQQLSVPLYDSFIVKTPGLSVMSVNDSVVRIDTSKKPNFVAAIQALHQLNGATPWDGCICIIGKKKAMVGSTIVASIMPQQEAGTIAWYTQKISICNPSTGKRQRV